MLSRTPMVPARFVAAAHRLLGEASAQSHTGSAAAQFSYRIGGGEALLVAYGPAAEALRQKGLPHFQVPISGGTGGRRRVLVKIRHLTPTLLKRHGGARLPCFDAEGYAWAIAGALKIAGLEVSAGEVMRGVEPVRIHTAGRPWDLGCGVLKGFVGELTLRMPQRWAEALRVASFTGLGNKRAWGMGNVEVRLL